MKYANIASSIALFLAAGAAALALTHAGPQGLTGPQGARGVQGQQGPVGPAGSPGSDGQTPYTAYDQVCWNQATNQTTGINATYYYPCTPNVSINPQP